MEEEINLREILGVIRRYWLIILLAAAAAGIGGYMLSLKETPVYTAETTIMVKSNGSATSSLAGLSGFAGINLPTGGGNLSDLTELVQSRAVAAKVFEDLRLRERIKGWNNPAASDQALISIVQSTLMKPTNSNGLIRLKVAFYDRELVADLANGYADALSYYWNNLNFSEAKKKREYIEGQLPRVGAELQIAEQRLKQYTLFSGASGIGAAGATGVAMPQAQGIEAARLTREYEIQNSVYTMLRKEYEQVKLDESKEIMPFSIIDRAQKPRGKWEPSTDKKVKIGLVVGLFSGILLAFFTDNWKKLGKSNLG
ncbi:MAG: Wzz/FepE/Etk N-terminal domain-containing protein [Candidatus Margulisbacteria bacterium]|nr:Wzz/FepE/Etk N-terminal domain-containing protein [Candidatus Margulisiibacteriota bacterium]